MKQHGLYMIFIFSVFSSCLDSPVMTTGLVNGEEKPTVVTGQADPFSDGEGNLVFHGEITSEGKSAIIEKGFYWSTISNDPGIKDNIVVVPDADSSNFTYELKNASGESTYYWRAYARNSYGDDIGEVQSCQTPLIWIAKQELPDDSRGRGVVFLLNNKIYITCGVKPWGQAFVTDTWEFSISTNQWAKSDSISFPGNNRDYPVAFTIGNYAYVGTGRQSLAYNDFYQFGAETKKWTQISTPDDLNPRYAAAAFSLNGNGYLVGGLASDRSGLSDVWKYNPNGGSWERKNDFPVIFYGGISINGNNKAFVGFGDAPETTRTLWEYDEINDSWNEFAKLPDEVSSKIYSGVIIQNTIYIVDGDDIIWALDMSDGTWKKKTYLPSGFLDENEEGGFQTLLTADNYSTVYVGLGFSKLLYEYHPLWDN